MDITLSRTGGIPVREQLARQIELKILGGEIGSGARLPSVRALARRLNIHPNTVSEAYQGLQAAGHVRLQRGAGVFVRGIGPRSLVEARDLEEIMRLAVDEAREKGYSAPQVQAAVARWLDAAPPRRIMAVDPSAELAELLVHEIRHRVGVQVEASSIETLAAEPGRAAGALLVCVPYHVERIRTLVRGALVEPATLEVGSAAHQAIGGLCPGAIVLVVSHAATVLPFAEVLMKSLRGVEIHVETRRLADRPGWRRMAAAADLVFADVLAAPEVRTWRPRRLLEFRVVNEAALGRIARALEAPVPRGT